MSIDHSRLAEHTQPLALSSRVEAEAFARKAQDAGFEFLRFELPDMAGMSRGKSTSNSTDQDAMAYLGAVELSRAFADRELSPLEVARVLLERIAALDAPVNALVHVDPRTTRAMAQASEDRHRSGHALSRERGENHAFRKLRIPLKMTDRSAGT